MLVIDTVSLSVFDFDNSVYQSSFIVYTYTLFLLIYAIKVTQLWLEAQKNSVNQQSQALDAGAAGLKCDKERFRIIFEEAAVGISHTDINGYILRVNQKYCQILGYSEAELLSMRFQDITHPSDLLNELPLQLKLLSLEQKSYSIEKRYIHRNGTFVWVNLTASVICNSNNEPIELVKVIEDISDKKYVKEAIKQQLFNEEIVQTDRNNLYIFDITGQQIIYANRYESETLDYSSNQIEAMLAKGLQSIAQLIQKEKMSSLGQVVAGVAHEINNPVNFIYANINPINEYTQDLLNLISLYRECYPEPVQAVQTVIQAIDLDFIKEDLPKILSSIQVGADRIRQIVLSLRNFSRLDEADMKLVDIHEGIDSTLLILQNRLKTTADQPGIEVVKDYGDIGKIECYPGELNQVFMNILNNAIDAINDLAYKHKLNRQYQGRIVITTHLNNQNQVVVKIIDNGCGMTEDTRRRIYDPFFTTKPVGSGSGLGMAVSYRVIEKHCGKLECSSIPGQGTAFTIILPK
ncbi:MAG: PAS domain S-box protein [Calothrix sp. C42_A2020_038]|nr:PAS domain S-box protein [Calothrix sp. C42_A2020_038]